MNFAHRFDVDGNCAARTAPFTKHLHAGGTGRIGYTWEAVHGLTFYSQYATPPGPPISRSPYLNLARPSRSF